MMPVLSISDGSILSFIARSGRNVERARLEPILAMLQASEAKTIASLLLGEKVTATEEEQRIADQYASWAQQLSA